MFRLGTATLGWVSQGVAGEAARGVFRSGKEGPAGGVGHA